MTSEEYIQECPRVTSYKAAAIAEDHYVDIEDFMVDHPEQDREMVDTAALLGWLGY